MALLTRQNLEIRKKEFKMTKKELFIKAHKMTKAVLKAGDNYRVTFAACLKAVKSGFTLNSKCKYKITGSTFERKNKIKKAGGKWIASSKCWIAELYKTDAIFRYDNLVFTAI
jgi:hypothetical protein